MSGIEAAGLVLGAFPLVISALEQFEKTKKITSTWWRWRRAYEQHLRQISLCQLNFTLNMKELLLPLLQCGAISDNEYKQLLASPGGSSWRDKHIEIALKERLTDSFDDYVGILVDMSATVTQMCNVCRVDDRQFQALRAQSPWVPGYNCNPQFMG